MNKKSVIWSTVGILITILIIIVKPFGKDVWDSNAEKLKEALQPISGNSVIYDLAEWTPFEWDTLYSFQAYATKKIIYETIGYKWDTINETVNEGMNQIVFVENGKVVCCFYGYPEDNKLGFNFGKYEGSYIKLRSAHKLSFEITISDEYDVKYLEYINLK